MMNLLSTRYEVMSYWWQFFHTEGTVLVSVFSFQNVNNGLWVWVVLYAFKFWFWFWFYYYYYYYYLSLNYGLALFVWWITGCFLYISDKIGVDLRVIKRNLETEREFERINLALSFYIQNRLTYITKKWWWSSLRCQCYSVGI